MSMRLKSENSSDSSSISSSKSKVSSFNLAHGAVPMIRVIGMVLLLGIVWWMVDYREEKSIDSAFQLTNGESTSSRVVDHHGDNDHDGSLEITALPNVSQMEHLTVVNEPNGFISDPDNLCRELLIRSNGTLEGEEPWRNSSAGLVYTPNSCLDQGTSVLGNHLSRWYIVRLIAADAGIVLESGAASCRSPVTDRIQTNHTFFPNKSIIDLNYRNESFSWRPVCEKGGGGLKYAHGEKKSALPHAVSMIRHDLQQLAKDLASSFEKDEVVIHIRCGDIARQNHPLYGLVPYHVYPNLIPNTTRFIGIVTAPFRQKRSGWGHGDAELNEAVVLGAQKYLASLYPSAHIVIRNNDTEPMDVVYARQVAADILICGPSTFCLYPSIATMGQSYILQSPLFGGVDTWINDLEKQTGGNKIHYVNDAYIPSTELYDLNVSDIIDKLMGVVD